MNSLANIYVEALNRAYGHSTCDMRDFWEREAWDSCVTCLRDPAPEPPSQHEIWHEVLERIWYCPDQPCCPVHVSTWQVAYAMWCNHPDPQTTWPDWLW